MADLRKLLSEATPGPWTYHETTIHGRKYGGAWVEGRQELDEEGRLGGMLIPISGSGGSMSYTTRVVDIQGHDDNDANARLISMAPDLAAALLEAMKALAVEHSYWDKIAQSDLRLQEVAYDYPMPLKMTEAMRKADALSAALDRIRKITGGE